MELHNLLNRLLPYYQTCFNVHTSRDHLPRGYSAQGWVVIKGHFVKPSWESSSFGRDDRIIDRVPMGDLSIMLEIDRYNDYKNHQLISLV